MCASSGEIVGGLRMWRRDSTNSKEAHARVSVPLRAIARPNAKKLGGDYLGDDQEPDAKKLPA